MLSTVTVPKSGTQMRVRDLSATRISFKRKENRMIQNRAQKILEAENNHQVLDSSLLADKYYS